MSADVLPYNPYSSPPPVEMPRQGAGRPGWLTAVCVIAIILGALGILSALATLLMTVFAGEFQAMMGTPQGPGISPEMQRVQDQFQKEMNAIQDRYFVAIIAVSLFHAVVAGMLLVGGIRSLGGSAAGRSLLLAAFVAAIVYEICVGVLQSFMNIEMNSAMNSYFEGLVGTMPSAGPPPEVMVSIMQGSAVVGYVLQYVLILAKIGFYVFGINYLRRPHITALFSNHPLGGSIQTV